MSKLIPLWQTTDQETCKLYYGDVLKTAQMLPGQSVQCIITSPPYWALRSYLDENAEGKSDELGSEKTPEEYVAKMVLIFRGLKRVLRNDGTLWLNLGDTYASGIYQESRTKDTVSDSVKGKDSAYARRVHRQSAEGNFRIEAETGLTNGNLVGIPWRVALALQADGWMLRQDIIWHKPNPMPESVQNRCTKAHEYIFLLTKSMDYYYDNEAIREDIKENSGQNMRAPKLGDHRADGNYDSVTAKDYDEIKGANKRSVWTVPSYAYPSAHYATFPPKLIEPCILAGTSEYGCCARCGEPYKRITQRRNPVVKNAEHLKRDRSAGNRNGRGDSTLDGEIPTVDTIGWEKQCICTDDDYQPLTDIVPCTVLDPFCGAATSAIVALNHKRRFWGIELSKQYIMLNQIPRIEGELQSRPDTQCLVPQ